MFAVAVFVGQQRCPVGKVGTSERRRAVGQSVAHVNFVGEFEGE